MSALVEGGHADAVWACLKDSRLPPPAPSRAVDRAGYAAAFLAASGARAGRCGDLAPLLPRGGSPPDEPPRDPHSCRCDTGAPLAEFPDGLALRQVDSVLRHRIERLWREVLPAALRPPAALETLAGTEAAGTAALRLFGALGTSTEFAELYAGPARNTFVLPALPGVANAVTASSLSRGLVASGLSGQRPTFDAALFICDSESQHTALPLPPIYEAEDALRLLQHGTIFMMSATTHWQELSSICLAVSQCLRLATSITPFMTAPRREMSLNTHTDNHNNFVLQCQGAKHWRVWSPPAQEPGKHPLHRGKGEDRLSPDDLGEPLIDVVLRPGQLIYLPKGFPHATDTMDSCSYDEPSVALTVQTFDIVRYKELREELLEHLHEDAHLDELALHKEVYWGLYSPVPAGFLVPLSVRAREDPCRALVTAVSAEVFRLIDLAEPGRLQKLTAVDGGARLARLAQDHVEFRLRVLLHTLDQQEEHFSSVLRGEGGLTCNLASHLSNSYAAPRRQDRGDTAEVRTDPEDGVPRTRAELGEKYGNIYKAEDIDEYWKSLAPMDTLVERAQADVKALLELLERRRPFPNSEEAVAALTATVGKSKDFEPDALASLVLQVSAGTEMPATHCSECGGRIDGNEWPGDRGMWYCSNCWHRWDGMAGDRSTIANMADRNGRASSTSESDTSWSLVD